MSYNTWPVFAGRGWDIKKRPITRTIVQTADGGQEFRLSRYQSALFEFDIEIPYLSQNDYNTLMQFFGLQGGTFTPFYFAPDNEVASNTWFATGDGTTKSFYLLDVNRYPCMYVVGTSPTPVFYSNGTPISGTLSGNNVVTFATAPAAGAYLTWTGVYYFIVRFNDDKIEIAQTMNQIYEATTITLRSVR